ncbi:dihydroorotate dehydrogenase [Alkalibacterium pelagium]|jgi:dihydroorotate dehydrogenase (fumarate)/dihydroorotate dehydrogenase (NAD+) catalytic subunit|uniref:Dihydroorotate dehydrogenase n=1 Tax=Alkalibacterium pelagium TaxID=426702 RepID=A0A1H7GJY0_9LACT|nr:dihydroorotate dehydrogenase [Alkalibacterium pelagium]GEN49777.1 dihydroorotate dehydrogenase [Alkalibacterium pelagium]SEK38408.1 dihydroorotate dehydrogenase (NAD+) catalytic subunit [Alkalibacterium pelagium]
MTRLSVSLPGLNMKNPVMPASGTFGFGDMYHDLYDYDRLGAIVLKSTTRQARIGNEDPKFHPLNHSALNAVGLKNPGVEKVVSEKLPRLHGFSTPVIGSVAGETEEEFVEVADILSKSGVLSALELNLSCPNVKEGGLTFGVDPSAVRRITEKVKQVTSLPVYVKLTPNVTDIVTIAKAAEEGGADGLSLINTVLGMNFDTKTRKPVLGNVMGGLSGESIFPIAVRMVYQVSREVSVPIIGMGGIRSADDVIQMFLAGASAVAVGTATYHNPVVMNEIIDALPDRMADLGIESIEDLIREVKEGRRLG